MYLTGDNSNLVIGRTIKEILNELDWTNWMSMICLLTVWKNCNILANEAWKAVEAAEYSKDTLDTLCEPEKHSV